MLKIKEAKTRRLEAKIVLENCAVSKLGINKSIRHCKKIEPQLKPVQIPVKIIDLKYRGKNSVNKLIDIGTINPRENPIINLNKANSLKFTVNPRIM
jgi:hypothetical protein